MSRSPAPRPSESADAADRGELPAARNAGSCRFGARRFPRRPSRSGRDAARGQLAVRAATTVTDWNCGSRSRLVYFVHHRGASSRCRGCAAILSHIAGPRSEQPAMHWRGCRSESAPGEITAGIANRPDRRTGRAPAERHRARGSRRSLRGSRFPSRRQVPGRFRLRRTGSGRPGRAAFPFADEARRRPKTGEGRSQRRRPVIGRRRRPTRAAKKAPASLRAPFRACLSFNAPTTDGIE